MPDINQKVSFLGASMHSWTMDDTLDVIEERLDKGEFTQHVVVNVAKLVNMRDDAQLRESVESCDIINIDGTGVVWGGRFLMSQLQSRTQALDVHSLLDKRFAGC